MADGFVPPQQVRGNAKRGLELRKKHGRGGTEVGVARARDLSNGAALSLDTIKRMNSYFARHEVDKKGEGWGVDSAGYIAWLLWGGDAGWSWAKGILRQQENKEKSTMTDLTTSYFSIEKADRQADGTLMVYGKATDDSLDIDQQICDAAWLDRAMPDWFKTGGNIREQHSSIAAGVAKEYEVKADGHYIHALVVDPISVKKVENGVLKGFSIGIKSPRVVRDNKAVNGRIIDGQIVEVSLVDRPANPNAKLILAKSVDGESSLVQVEELTEDWIGKKEEEDFTQVIKPRKGEPADKDLYEEVKRDAKAKFDVYPSAYANAWVVREYKKRGGKYKAESKKGLQSDTIEMEFDMTAASELVEVSKSFASADLLKFDQKTYDAARTALADLIQIEAKEMSESGHSEEYSLQCLLSAVHHLFAWYEGEKAEGETMEEVIEMASKPEVKELKPMKGETEKEYKARCKEAGMDDETIKAMCDKYMGAEKSADIAKCLECGCNQPGSDHGLKTTNDFANIAKPSHVTTAEMYAPGETPKSAEADEAAVEEAPTEETPAETPVEEAVTENSEAPTEVDAADVEAIVEQVVKSATESLRAEIASLVAAKEVALEKSVVLESELAIAKSLAVAGGPSRTAKPLSTKINDNLTKAAIYKAKANATTDPVLAKGYKQLAEEFYSKASDSDNN